MIIDCSTCPARARSCDGCVVAVMFGSSADVGSFPTAEVVALDRDERRAVTTLLSAGLITAREAASVRSRQHPVAAEHHECVAG